MLIFHKNEDLSIETREQGASAFDKTHDAAVRTAASAAARPLPWESERSHGNCWRYEYMTKENDTFTPTS